MLRSAVLIAGVLLLGCAALLAVLGGFPPALACLIWGALIVGGVVFERVRYKNLETGTPSGNWVRTSERFIDDETGAPVTVWVDPQTGERKYVRD